mgnify:CR=1 FL=1
MPRKRVAQRFLSANFLNCLKTRMKTGKTAEMAAVMHLLWYIAHVKISAQEMMRERRAL